MRHFAHLATIVAFSIIGSAAHAAAVVSTTDPGGSLDNVLANNCNGSLTQSGATTVQGCLNSDRDKIVDLTGDENMVYSGGQATIDAADGRFDDLRIEFNDGTRFNLLSLNIDAYLDGMVSFYGDIGAGDFLIGTMNLDGNGENRFYIYTTLASEFFNYVRFEASLPNGRVPAPGQNVADVKQVRIGGLEECVGDDCGGGPNEVPEPATLGLLGLGLGALAFGRRRKA